MVKEKIDLEVGKLLETNYKLMVSISSSEKVFVGAKSFYSSNRFSILLNKLKKVKLKTFLNEDIIKVKIILLSKVTKTSKTFYLNANKDSNPNDIIQEAKDEVLKIEGCVDVNSGNKYRVVIDNCQSYCKDSKSVSFVSEYNLDVVIGRLKVLMNEIVDAEKEIEIVFSYEKVLNSTHRITLQKSGSLEDYKKYVSKTFSIKLPNYSSTEVVNLVRRNLR